MPRASNSIENENDLPRPWQNLLQFTDYDQSSLNDEWFNCAQGKERLFILNEGKNDVSAKHDSHLRTICSA